MLTLLQPSLVYSRSRRKGQALILAVLVMLFAVLLSSAFLVIVGNNGRQVGRETDRSEASRNADKGVAFVIAKLRSSSTPDTWDPRYQSDFAPLPATTSDAQLYYSQLDKTMGWDVQGFVKYPNPLTSRQAPQFLVSSHLMGTDPSGADSTTDGDKRFMLRITVIGLSSKNPELWSRRIFYKTTNWNGGTFSYANFVTSFDSDTQQSVVSKLTTATVSTAPTVGSYIPVPIYAYQNQGNDRIKYSPRIAEVGNTLMISDGKHDPVVGLVNTSTLSGDTYTINLRVLRAGTVTGTFDAYSKVALVGSLFELPQQIDTDGTGAAASQQGTTPQNVVGVRPDATPIQVRPFGNGAQFNNGFSIPVTTTFVARQPRQPVAVPGIPVAGQNALSSDGPISIGDPSTTVANPQYLNLINADAQPTPVQYTTPIPSENQFFRAGFNDIGAPQRDVADSATAPAVAPRSIKPAQLNFAAYRAVAISGSASATGLYIKNTGDVEKFNGKPLTTSQLQRLWQRKSFTVDAGGNIGYTGTNVAIAAGTNTTSARLCYGRPGVDSYIYPMASEGLEAEGIRGWISPWEFLPRGAQVILNPSVPAAMPPRAASITVIMDPLSDNSTSAPDLNKAINPATRQFSQTFTPATGTPATGDPTTGPLPFYLAAEGNLRVKGTGVWDGPPISIVSNNNIYIEGSMVAPPGQIALLAKKNLILNPTQFVSRPTGTVDTSVGQTAFKGSASGGIVTVTSGIESFKVGDKVAVFAPKTKADGWHTVQSINGNQLTFLATDPAIVDATEVKVKLACDPPIVLIKANVADSTTDFYQGKVAPGTSDDTLIQEFDPTTNPATAGTAYAYKFAVGGDTLARNVPFNVATGQGIGVAMRETVAKKNLIFTVQGGKDQRDPNDPADDIDDDGQRNLESRTSTTNRFELGISPKSGQVTSPTPNPNSDTFDLTQLAPTPVPPAPTPTPDDGVTNLLNLQTQLKNLSPSDTDAKTNRWRLILPPVVAGATTGVQDSLAARRLSVTSISAALGINAASDTADPDETTPTRIRVPLTPSIVLFAGGLTTTSPDVTALSRIGTTFGFLQAAIDPTNETRFVKATDLAKDPIWDQPTASGATSVVNYKQTTTNNDIGWTRDGAGDYDDQLPPYYVSGWHFQKVAQDAAISPNPNNVAPTGSSIPPSATAPVKTNMTVEVDATIYAEGGSWFVIPVPTPNANNAIPTDPEQQIEWRRPAYGITINGNITQMMTPTATYDYDDEPDPDGVAVGAMKRWTDALSYQINGGTWQTINYRSAPLPALLTNGMGIPVIDTRTGQFRAVSLPRLPSSSDILYTYSN